MSAARGCNVDDALKMIDGALRDPDFASAKSGLINLKFQMLAGNKERADEAAAVAIEMLSDESLDAGGVNNLAWNLYNLAQSNRFRNEEVIRAAIDASERVVDNAGAQEPYLRDTIAHLYHELGDLETALEQQQVAFDAADESMKPRLAPFLNQLKKELEQANAPEEEAKEGASEEDGSGEASSDQSDTKESDSGDAEE